MPLCALKSLVPIGFLLVAKLICPAVNTTRQRQRSTRPIVVLHSQKEAAAFPPTGANATETIYNVASTFGMSHIIQILNTQDYPGSISRRRANLKRANLKASP